MVWVMSDLAHPVFRCVRILTHRAWLAFGRSAHAAQPREHAVGGLTEMMIQGERHVSTQKGSSMQWLVG